MATYQATGPDGNTYRLDGPDDASQSDILQAFQYHFNQQNKPQIQAPAEASGEGHYLLHSAERGVGPAAAGLAGFGAGAAAAAPLDPFTFGAASLAGGLIAGGLAAYGASKAQEAALKAAPGVAKSIGQDPETQAAEQKSHPYATAIAESAPSFLALRPSGDLLRGGKAALDALKVSAANSVLAAGMDAGQQAAGGQPIDWTQVGISAGIGAAGTKETALGKKIIGAGRAIVPWGREVPPPVEVPPVEVPPVEVPPVKSELKQQLELPIEPPPTVSVDDLLAGPKEPGNVTPPTPVPSKEVVASATAEPVLPFEKEPTTLTLPFEAPAQSPPVEPVANIPPVVPPTGGANSLAGEPVASFLPTGDLKTQILNHIRTGEKAAVKDFITLTGQTRPEIIKALNELKQEAGIKYNRSTERWEAPDNGSTDSGIGRGSDHPGTGVAGTPEPRPTESPRGMEVPVDRDAALEGTGLPQNTIPRRLDDTTTSIDQPHVGEEGGNDTVKPQPLNPATLKAKLLAARSKPQPLPEKTSEEKEIEEYLKRNPISVSEPQKITNRTKGGGGRQLDSDRLSQQSTSAPDWAQAHANELEGSSSVVYSDDKHALVRGFNLYGEPIYLGVSKSGSRTRTGIDKYTGNLFNPQDLNKLKIAAQNEALREQQYNYVHPDGPFENAKDNVVSSRGINPDLHNFVSQLTKSLGMGRLRIFMFHPKDIRGENNEKLYNLKGQYGSPRSANLIDEGGTRQFGPGLRDFYISLKSGLSDHAAIETVSHEIGHIIEKVAYRQAPDHVRMGIMKAFEDWFERTKHFDAHKLIDELRNRETSIIHRASIGSPNVKLNNNYWRSFAEWFADNTSRWATTSEKPLTIVQKFFKGLALRLRDLAAKVTGKTYLPAPAMKEFLDKMGPGSADLWFTRADTNAVIQRSTAKQTKQTKQAPAYKDKSADEIINDIGTDAQGKKYSERYEKPQVLKTLKNFFTTKEGFNEGVKNIQNHRRPIQQLEEELKNSGKLDESNNLYTRITNAQGLSANKARNFEEDIKGLNKTLVDYASKAGISVQKALSILHAYIVGLHELERRHINFLENVPLNNTVKLLVGKVLLTPADIRREILKQLYSNKDLVSNGTTQQLKTQLENLVQKYKDPAGYSPRKGSKSGALNEDSSDYNVIGDYTRQEIKNLRDAYNQDPNKNLVDQALAHVKTLQEKAAELDRQANYRPQAVDNIIDFYGWKHYLPFKGDPTVGKDSPYEFNGKRMSGELNQFAEKAEGRDTDSENPILQAVADAGRSAGRAARVGVTEAVKNLIDQGHIPGRFVKTVTFQDRLNGLTKEDIQGPQRVFHYKNNGDVDVYSVHNKPMAEAIKGFTNEVSTPWRVLNKINNAFGQLHTRYSLPFAPYNYVRHAVTSALIAGAEKGGYLQGPAMTTKFLAQTTRRFLDFSVPRAARAWSLYNSDGAKLAQLAKNNPFIRDMKEYLDNGGMLEFYKGFSIKNQVDDLVKQVGRSKFMSTMDQVKKYFDIYNAVFELTGRTAGYGVIKQDLINKYKASGKQVSDKYIQQEATAYTKNLFNYEQVGKYGREAGALYMFFRPSLTTAVRALDAIAPAFQPMEKAIAAASKHLNSDPVAFNRFKQDYQSKQQSARILTAGMIGSGMALYHMALLGAETDEQGRNKIATDDMSLWERNLRLPLYGVGGADYLQLPWGFGLGSFGALGAQLASMVEGNNTPWGAIKSMIPVALDSYMPLPVPKFNPSDHPLAFLVGSVVPTFARPMIEYGFNVDDFGREIHNDRASAFGDAYTGGEHLPEAYSAATKLMADTTHGLVNISPSTLHFWTNSYLDGAARILHDGYGLFLTATGQKNFDLKRDVPILDSFIGKSSSYDTREFNEVSQEIARKQAVLKMYANNPVQLDRYRESHPNDEMVVKLYQTQVSGMLNQVNRQIGAIQADPDMSLKEKTEMLKELHEQQNWIKRGIIDAIRDYQD